MSHRLKIILVSALLVLFAGCVNRSSSADDASSADPTLGKEIQVLVLEGSPYERGLTHGKTLKKDIHEVVALWKAQLASQSKTDADAFIETFLEETNFAPAIEKWTPDLLEEVRGIADGAEEGSLGIADIKSTLSSQDDSTHPVCRPHDPGKSSFTFGTVIQVLSDSPELHLAPGPPNVTPFQVFPFSKGS